MSVSEHIVKTNMASIPKSAIRTAKVLPVAPSWTWNAQSDAPPRHDGTTTTGFQHLPLELRNKIYMSLIEDIPALTIRGVSDNTNQLDYNAWRQNLHTRLPACLNLNRQFRKEAIEEIKHSAIRIVKNITIASPDDLLNIIPTTTRLSNLRHLVFTRPQTSYDTSPTLSSYSIHDIVSRCPQLEELTIPISASIFQNDYESSFSHLFKHDALQKLCLNCIDAPSDWTIHDCPRDVRIAQPFERWFLREGRKRRRRVGLSIDLSPGESTDWYEDTRVRVGCITHVVHMDFFG